MAEFDFELCWGTCRGVALPELIDVAGSNGFGAFTITPELYYLARRDGFSDAELRHRLADAGTRISVIEPLTHGLPGISPAHAVAPELRSMMHHTEDECYRAAEAVGVTLISVAHFLGGPQPTAELVDAVGNICENARRHGLSIAIEFIPGTGFPDAESTATLIRAVGAPNLGITFDTWHFNRSGGTVAALADLHAPIASLQVNDSRDRGPQAYVPMVDRLLPGEGVIEIAAMVDELLPRMADPRVGIEVFNGALRRMPPAAAVAAALSATRTVLAR